MTEGRENSPDKSDSEGSHMSSLPPSSLLPEYPISCGRLLGPFSDPLQWLAYKCTDKGNSDGIERRLLELFQVVEIAREPEEQNLEIVLRNGEFYFRALQDVNRTSGKLLAWFCEDLSSRLPIPSSTTVNGSKRFYCGLCNHVFLHPNPVVVHVLFNCSKRHEIIPGSIITPSSSAGQTQTPVRAKKRGFDIESLVNDEDPKKFKNEYVLGNNAKSAFQPPLSPASFADNQDRLGSASGSSGVTPLLSSLSPMTAALTSNNHIPSAFRKVDKSGPPSINSNANNANYEYPSFYGNSRMIGPAVFPSPNSYPLSNAIIPPPSSGVPSSGSSMPTSNGNPNNRNLIPPSLLPFLPPSLAALSFPQTNWCAKCNATFRMTSDLVYHMRSHHKNYVQADPLKKKREEKLRCNICGETFRERHHLTRHMTSHQ